MVNGVTYDYVGWTFKKHPKFFDIVSYTGDTNIQKVLSHSLGSDPGMVIIKSTNTAGTSWWTWHTSFGANTSDIGKQMALDSIKGTRDTGTIYIQDQHLIGVVPTVLMNKVVIYKELQVVILL